MHTLTKGSFKTLEDDKATSLEMKALEQEKQERNTAEKKTSRVNPAQGSVRALLALVITMCLISLAVLLLTLLMLFGKIGDGCGCFAEEASSTSDKRLATDTAKIKALEENIRSLQLGLMEHFDDLAKVNNTLIKTEAGYNALRNDLNMTRSELLLITDNITLTLRLEYLDAVLTRLKSALNRTNTDLAELKSTQTKEKVIYHQTMTPSWLEGHASYISIYSTITTEQLTFTAGSSSHAALFNVPMIPANVLQNYTQITVKIVVSNDVKIGTNQDSDPKYGVSDGISFVGFETSDRASGNTPPCFGIEESSGTTLTGKKVLRSPSDPRPRDSFYPGQFVITLKLDAHENWGSCYTAHDGGFVKTAVYNKRLILSNGLTLEGYRDNSYERYGIKVIEVTIVEDV
ncbi:uncharacterized protein LOC144635215 [Oculina patagonica]